MNVLRSPRHLPSPPDDRRAQRGQVIVIFAGAMVLFVLLCAAVIDMSWYWTSNLRMQRAADAAALAGVVFLPGDTASAYATARAEAAKNGYTDGINNVVVTPIQDPGNDRRLDVEISAPVNTYFARVIGINSFNATRDSNSEYVLPVPMGSPQNYYGVGFYEDRVQTNTDVPAVSGYNVPGLSTAGGGWTNPDRVFAADNSYATAAASNSVQVWQNFGLQPGIPNDPTLVIDSVEVRLANLSVTGSGIMTNCQVKVETSWDSGTTWSASKLSGVLTANAIDDYSVGSTADPWNHTWTRGDFATGAYRVRLTWTDGTASCAATRDVQLDQLDTIVRFHTVTTSWTNQTLSVNDPVAGTPLASQGFWGAMFTSGGYRENGDRFAPSFIGNGTGAGPDTANPDYDPAGYDYILELPGGSGQVRLFDPIFCATGDNGHGGSYGAGDHWTGAPGGQVTKPVSITYRLYDTKGTVGNPNDDGLPIQTLTYDPGNGTLGDLSGNFGSASGTTDCSSNAAHNKWVTMKSALASGTYRLNVNTSIAANNLDVGAENLFSIWVKSGGSARVYGSGRMAAYTNLAGGLQAFYFAQIDSIHAGKTMVVELFDPGEVSGNGYLRFQSPDGNAYNYATFNWKSDDGRSGTNVTQIQTAINGAAQFNNRLITIEIPLPTTYGSAGLDPPGDITSEPGWWRVEYNVSGGNDTTTWGVSIRGNPVHLILP